MAKRTLKARRPRPAGARGKFDESKHKRDAGGRFAVKTLKEEKKRVFEGEQRETRSRLSKLETGEIGEQIAIAHLKRTGLKDARPLNTQKQNFPVDLIAGNTLIEVKTGLISNSRAAQQWRATIGQPGPAETAWLKRAGAEAKSKWNAEKAKAILDRKNKVVRDMSRITGKRLKPKTLTLIIDPDRRSVDVFEFDNFHSRIGWTSDAAKAAYKGTYRYG